MADEIRKADLGLEFKIEGLQQAKDLNQLMDKIVGNFKTIGREANQAETSIGKMASDSSNKANGLTNDLNRVSNATNDINRKVRDVQRSVMDIKSNTIDGLNNSFKNATNSADNTGRAVQNVKHIADQVSSSSIKRLGESTSETGKRANESTSKFRDLVDRVKSISGEVGKGYLQKLGQSTKQAGEEAKDASGKFKHLKDTALGVFAGNALFNGWQGLASGIKDAVTQGLQFNEAAEDMKKRWSQAGLSASSSDAMVKQISDIRQHADISAAAINNMQKQYLVLTGSASQARALTSTITSFGSASGMNEEQQGRVARLISSNKNVNARMFNRTLGQSPAFANEIIKQTGMSKQAFYSLLQSGKLTGQQLRDAMIKASKDSNVAWSDYAKTAQGKMALVNVTIANTKKAFESNLTQSMFDQINKAAGNSKGLDKLQKNVEKTAKDVGKAIGSILGGVVGFIAKNIKPIEGVAKAVWSIVSAIASGAWKTFTGIFGIFTSKTGKASNGLKTIDKVLTGLSKHQSMLQNIGKLIVAAFAAKKIYQFGSAIGKGINIIRGFATAMKLASAQGTILNAVMDANPFGLIALAIAGLVVGVVELYKHFKPFRNLVNGTFKAISKAVGSWWKQVKKNFKAVQNVIGTFAKFIKKYFGNVIKDEMKVAKNVFKVIGDVIRIFKDIFTLNFKDLGKVIPKLGKDLWNTIKGIWKAGSDFVIDIGSNMWKSIWNTFKSWGKSIGNFFSDLWKGIKEEVADGINDVTGIINDGIKGLNWILSKVGGSGHTIGYIPKVHFANGTMGGRLTRHTMAMLNDGNDSPETDNKEMAILPNGKAFIPQKRNWVGMLPKGTAVLNATETKMFMQMRGIEKFGSGTGFLSWAKRTAGKVANVAKHDISRDINGVKDVAGSMWSGAKKVANAIAHPIKFIEHFFGKLPKMPEFLTDFGGGVANKAKDALIAWFKKFGDNGANNPSGSGVQRWKKIIEQAGAFMHESLSGSDISLILSRIQRESGGNPTIKQQVSDVNSAAGHPAQGLLQYVPSTFASWAVSGHNNLLNGYDQLLAMFNDSNWRTDIANNGGWGPTGHRARKTGGPVSRGQWYKVNEEGQEFFKPSIDGQVVNHNDSKRIINGANKPINIKTTMNVTINGNADSKNIEKKLHDSYEEHTRMIAEKLSQSFGANEGGYYPI